MSESRRVFFALWPDAATRSAIADYTRDAIVQAGGRAIPAENFHITLRFIGMADAGKIKLLEKAAGRTFARQIQLKLDRLGYWPEPAVYWLGCRKAPDELLRLVVNLNAELGGLGFPPEHRPFKPHVTLARDVANASAGELEIPLSWTSDRFALMESLGGADGVEYRVLKEWPLPAVD